MKPQAISAQPSFAPDADTLQDKTAQAAYALSLRDQPTLDVLEANAHQGIKRLGLAFALAVMRLLPSVGPAHERARAGEGRCHVPVPPSPQIPTSTCSIMLPCVHSLRIPFVQKESSALLFLRVL